MALYKIMLKGRHIANQAADSPEEAVATLKALAATAVGRGINQLAAGGSFSSQYRAFRPPEVLNAKKEDFTWEEIVEEGPVEE